MERLEYGFIRLGFWVFPGSSKLEEPNWSPFLSFLHLIFWKSDLRSQMTIGWNFLKSWSTGTLYWGWSTLWILVFAGIPRTHHHHLLEGLSPIAAASPWFRFQVGHWPSTCGIPLARTEENNRMWGDEAEAAAGTIDIAPLKNILLDIQMKISHVWNEILFFKHPWIILGIYFKFPGCTRPENKDDNGKSTSEKRENKYTPLENKRMSREDGWLEDEFPFGMAYVQRLC